MLNEMKFKLKYERGQIEQSNRVPITHHTYSSTRYPIPDTRTRVPDPGTVRVQYPGTIQSEPSEREQEISPTATVQRQRWLWTLALALAQAGFVTVTPVS